jgi:hypothetical protein
MTSFHSVNENNSDTSSLIGGSGATSGASISRVGTVRSTDALVDLVVDHC